MICLARRTLASTSHVCSQAINMRRPRRILSWFDALTILANSVNASLTCRCHDRNLALANTSRPPQHAVIQRCQPCTYCFRRLCCSNRVANVTDLRCATADFADFRHVQSTSTLSLQTLCCTATSCFINASFLKNRSRIASIHRENVMAVKAREL